MQKTFKQFGKTAFVATTMVLAGVLPAFAAIDAGVQAASDDLGLVAGTIQTVGPEIVTGGIAVFGLAATAMAIKPAMRLWSRLTSGR